MLELSVSWCWGFGYMQVTTIKTKKSNGIVSKSDAIVPNYGIISVSTQYEWLWVWWDRKPFFWYTNFGWPLEWWDRTPFFGLNLWWAGKKIADKKLAKKKGITNSKICNPLIIYCPPSPRLRRAEVEHIGIEPMTSWLPGTIRGFPPDSIKL